MYCYQCQETLNCTACVRNGVCGKPGEVADVLDVLTYVSKSVAVLANKAAAEGVETKEADVFVMESLFLNVTNVSFSRERVMAEIFRGLKVKRKLAEKLKGTYMLPEAALWNPEENEMEVMKAAGKASVLAETNEDIRSLKALVLYGLRGVAAYANHAYILGYTDQDIFKFFHKALDAVTVSGSADELLGIVMETGNISVKTMALLDRANTETYGKPEITMAGTGTVAGKAILVSGHDLKDFQEILEQTRGRGINVYTHGEMLPANAYPVFKKFSHLKGNYGTSWWAQQEEFDKFNGAIIMTTNCIQKPKDSYKDRIFTTGLVSFDGVKHIADRLPGGKKDFGQAISKALELEGLKDAPGKKLAIGFAHDAVLAIADKIVAAVKSGAIKKFVVMGGCDGRHKSRAYYTQTAKNLPGDAVILTAGCAKYRYNMLDLGDIGGIPRVIDAGQCNDSYSLAVIALKLKEVFGLTDVNQLPIEFDIAWYEQKAVAVLLALLALGFKNIQVGPTLPSFVSPNVGAILSEKFGLKAPAIA